MKKVIKIDENGFFIVDAIVEDNFIKENYVDIECQEGFYKPRFIDGKWIEGITEEELKKLEEDNLKNITLEERIAALENLVMGVI